MSSRLKKTIIIIASVMVLAFAISGIVLYATGGISAVAATASQIQTSRVFESSKINKVVINTVNTNINLIPASDNKISIDFYGNITSNIAKGLPELSAYEKDGTLNISVIYPRTIIIGLINLSSLYLDIYVPDNYPGEINIETVSGGTEVKDFSTGGFYYKSISGEFSAKGFYAENMQLESTSGRINLEDSWGRVNASSVSGAIDLKITELANDINIKTVSGAVKVKIPAASQFNFDIGSISGEIYNDFSARINHADGRNFEGSVGQGASKLTISTTSGNIKIMKGE
jgi:DUF4097 and DUF4098 domain-containing protein YvlB